ncbi:MAG: hypothetical protein ABI811_20630 [Acidobacteriota bacterium]
MKHAALFALLLSGSTLATAADWTEYKIGPLRVVSNAGDADARTRLTEMEQLRYVLGGMLGKDPLRNEELDTVWPITLVLFDSDRDAAAYALPAPFVEGGSRNLSSGKAGAPPAPAWRHEVARQLIEANAGRMPQEIETALADIFSTIEVKTTRVAIGAPVPGLTGTRLRAWARFHMLATQPDYAGRVRVYLRNLQGGDPQLAARNTYAVEPAELDRRMNAYADAGKFTAADVFGKALSPQREFYERRLEEPEVAVLLEELKAAGKSFSPDSPRGLLAAGTRESLYAAIAANPKWAEPHARIAALMVDPKSRIAPLEKATQLEPRHSEYWEALAKAQTAANMFIEASKSWLGAERAAGTEAERARIRRERAAIEEQRVEAEMAIQRAARDEAERELRRVIAESEARVKAAETSANRANTLESGPSTGQAAVSFKEGFSGIRVEGRLTEVECVDSILKLMIQVPNKSTTVVLVRANPIDQAGQPVFKCGPVDPARRIEVVHNGKADIRWNTVGEVDTYDLK